VIDITSQIDAIHHEVATKPAEGCEVVSAMLRHA